MRRFTKKEYLEFTEHTELAKAVLKQIQDKWTNIIKYTEDFATANAGVSGFIYYNETVDFTTKNYALIDDIIRRFEYETDVKFIKPSYEEGIDIYYNWMAWFALETIIHDIMYWKEQKDIVDITD